MTLSKRIIRVLGGVLFLNEEYSLEAGSTTDRGADAQFLIQFTTNRFTKFQFDTQAGMFPSLTDLGRVRISLDSYLKRELFRNFNVKVTVYENYDTHPPVSAPKNDLGTTTSLGWTV
jgi:hypothetical protein